jgi:methionine aminopeptidase
MKAIESVKPGTLYRDFGEVITKMVGKEGHQVVRSYW